MGVLIQHFLSYELLNHSISSSHKRFKLLYLKSADSDENSWESIRKITSYSLNSGELNSNDRLYTTKNNICILYVLWVTKYSPLQLLSSAVTRSFNRCAARNSSVKNTEMVLWWRLVWTADFTESCTWLKKYAWRRERLQHLLSKLAFSMSCRQAERY